MALQRQSVEIPFVAGVDGKRHPHRALVPGLNALENADLSEPGAVKKRRGYWTIGNTVVDGGSAPSAWKRIDSIGKRALLWDDDGLYEYVDEEGELAQQQGSGRGVVASASSEILPNPPVTGVIPASFDVLYAYANGYELYACGSAGTWSVHVRDSDTKAVAISTLASGDEIAGAAVAVGNYLMFFFVNGSDLKCLSINTGSLPTSPSAVTVASDVHGTAAAIDASVYNGEAVVVYSTTTPSVKIATVNTSGVIQSSTTFDTVAADSAIGVYASAAGHVVAYSNTTGGLKIQGVTTAIATDSSHTLDAGATACRSIVLEQADTSASVLVIYGEADNVTIDRVSADGSSSTYTARVLYGDTTLSGYRIDIASKPLRLASGLYLLLSRGSRSVGDNSLVLVRLGNSGSSDDDAEPIAMFRPFAEAPGSAFNAGIHAGIFAVGSEYRTAVTARRGVGSGTDVPMMCSFELHSGDSAEGLGALMLPGFGLYVGGSVEQPGWPWPPRIISVTKSNGAGSLTNSGAYSWVATYKYTDRAGNSWESPPSPPSTSTMGASDDTADIEVTAPFVREGITATVKIYRTSDAGTVHYAAAEDSQADTIKDAGTVTVTDTISDSSLATQAVLYTDAGILDAYPPPSTGRQCIHGNRVWVIGDDGSVRPSREIVEGEGPGWHPTLAIHVGGRVARPAAIASSGDGGPLVVFFPKRIGYIYGDGPSDTGTGGAWSAIQFLEGVEVGTENPRSVVNTPDGIMFEDADRGVYLLPSGSSTPVPVGDKAVDLFTSSPVAAHVCHDRKEVRFFLSARKWVCYHYEPGWRDEQGFGAWSVSDGKGLGSESIVDAAVIDGRSVFVTDGGTIRREVSSGSGHDVENGELEQYVPLKVTTGYVPLGSLQGMKRLWDVYVQGEVIDDHALAVAVEYDRAGSSDDFSFSSAEVTADLEDDGLRCHMVNQSLQVARVTIEDSTALTATTGEGPALTGLRLEFGVQPRGRRGAPKAAS